MKNSEIENTHPYPGVFRVKSKINPWVAVVQRKDIGFWSKVFPTPEAARDARIAKLKKHGLEPRKTHSDAQDRISEMNKLIDFEDRVTTLAA